MAKFLQAKGAPLGGLGLQGHIGTQPNAPVHVLATLDAYAGLKLPIVSPNSISIPTTKSCRRTTRARTFRFSPTVIRRWWACSTGDFGPRRTGAHAGRCCAPTGRQKPAAAAYRALVLKQWRTKLQGKAGATGKVGGDGFHGDYVVTVERDGRRAEQRFTLRAEEAKTVVKVALP